jgi:C4-dicarboxylate-specific signal transduction histidine kinase
MVNLLQNAHDAVGEGSGGSVRVSARRHGHRTEIVIDDDGVGVPETVQRRLFEPFATTKPPGKGTGLGLYTSYMLVTAMRGSLALENRPEGGARAVVSLPAAGAELVQLGRGRPVEAAE